MSRPVHICIRDDLRARLLAGEWAAGERLPSETGLAANYGVARMTIRQAIGALALEGVVVRKQGIGTFAVDQRPMGWVSKVFSFAEEMRRQGHQVQAKLLGAVVEQPPPAAREALQLHSSAAAVLVRRARLVDGSPVIVESSWLPNARFVGLAADPLLNGSLYATLERNYGVSVARITQVLAGGAADQQDAADLDLRAGTPVLLNTRTAYDNSGRPVEFAVTVWRSKYLIETFIERSTPTGPKTERSSGRSMTPCPSADLL